MYNVYNILTNRVGALKSTALHALACTIDPRRQKLWCTCSLVSLVSCPAPTSESGHETTSRLDLPGARPHPKIGFLGGAGLYGDELVHVRIMTQPSVT